MLDIAFVDDQEEDGIEGVLSEELGDPMVEESLEEEGQEKVQESHAWQFIEEEVEVVGEEAYALVILLEELLVRVGPVSVEHSQACLIEAIVSGARSS